MGNVHMEATQINYRGGNKKMGVEEAIKAAGDDISTLKSGFTNLDNEVNGDATVYPYADVITIEDAIPSNLADCSVKIEPVQSGSGDPSPTNVRPITGHTEVDVQRDGKNLMGILGLWKDNGEFDNTINGLSTAMFPVSVGQKVTCSKTKALTTPSGHTYILLFDDNKNFINRIEVQRNIIIGGVTYTVPAGTSYVAFTVYMNADDWADKYSFELQVELCSTATPYVPYLGKTYTIALGDTIYGGTVDFDSGVMTVTMAQIASYDGETIGKPWISDRDVYAEGVTPTTGAQVVYTLATPTTIQLTPQQIQLLKGTNTITASTGQISVTVNGVSGAIGAVQEQVNGLAEQLPDAPTTDGTYNLQVTVASGVPTYSWVSGS